MRQLGGIALVGATVGLAGLTGLMGMTGCFYVDPINQRPAIDIRQTSPEVVYRGDMVDLVAVDNDPEGQQVSFSWRAYACTDASDPTTCDQLPFFSGQLREAHFAVQPDRNDVGVPTRSVLVILQAKDEYGAIARPDDRLIIPIANYAPDLQMSLGPLNSYIEGQYVYVYARISDRDDAPPTNLTTEWTVFSPLGVDVPALEEVDVIDTDPTNALQLGQRFIPSGLGMWEVQATVTDPLGAKTTQTLMFEVGPDDPPCLAQWSPIAAAAPDALVITDPTLFAVDIVDDDLDPYPAASTGSTTFTWSLKEPGAATRTILPGTTNAVPIDPAVYTPGDILELRVEIADRKNNPINCADDQATCAGVPSDPSCIQRQTWRVEVR